MSSHIERGALGDGLCAILDDGSSFFVPTLLVSRLELFEGLELDDVQTEALRESVLVYEARRKILDYQAAREHSSGELRRKLSQGTLRRERRYPDHVIDRAVKELTEEGYIDDLKFSEAWIESRLRKQPEGRDRLRAGLQAKGVSREVVQVALERQVTDAIMHETLEKLVTKALARSGGMDARRLAAFLSRKGFSRSEVRHAVEAVFGDLYGGD